MITPLHRRITPFQVAFIGLTFLVILVGLQGTFFFRQKMKAEAARQWVTHTHEVLSGIRIPFAKIKDAELGQRGFLLTGEKKFLEPYYAAIGSPLSGPEAQRMGYLDHRPITGTIAHLRILMQEDPLQQKTLDRLEILLQQKLEHIKKSLRANEHDRAAMLALVRSPQGKALMDEIRALMTEMLKREQLLLTERIQKDLELEAAFTSFIVISACITYGILLIALLLLTRNSARILRSERELHEKESHFHAVVEGTTDAFFIFQAQYDKDKNLQGLLLEYANPKAEFMFGAFFSKMKSEPIETMLRYQSGNAEEIKKTYFEVLQKKIPRESEFCTTFGPVAGRCFTEQAIPFDGGIAVVYRDITERKSMERMKNEFISTVSHELRTPLTSIRGSLGLITGGLAGEVSSDAKGLLTIAYNNCERLVRLINDILDIEKIESGKMTFKCHPLPLLPLIRQAIDANVGFAEKYGVRIALVQENGDIASEALKVVADSDRLTQVLTNLISNAIKFSSKDDTVRVRCAQIDDHVRITIEDSGSGIPQQFQSRIFQKFAQADSSDTRQKGGTGLGLSIVKAIVEEMKGQVGFTSEEGKGTTFYFTLPVEKPTI